MVTEKKESENDIKYPPTGGYFKRVSYSGMVQEQPSSDDSVISGRLVMFVPVPPQGIAPSSSSETRRAVVPEDDTQTTTPTGVLSVWGMV